MTSEVLHAIETGALGQVSVVAFFVAFILMVAYAFTLPRFQRDEAKNIPLEDDNEL